MRNTYTVQAAFGTVVWVVCGVGLVAALAGLLLSGKTWADYGKRRLTMEDGRSNAPGPGSAAATLERETEIRQLLQARNHHRRRRGDAPIEIEPELRRLKAAPAGGQAPQLDGELLSEIRVLVEARNYRRRQAGKPPLDVASEIEREIARLR